MGRADGDDLLGGRQLRDQVNGPSCGDGGGVAWMCPGVNAGVAHLDHLAVGSHDGEYAVVCPDQVAAGSDDSAKQVRQVELCGCLYCLGRMDSCRRNGPASAQASREGPESAQVIQDCCRLGRRLVCQPSVWPPDMRCAGLVARASRELLGPEARHDDHEVGRLCRRGPERQPQCPKGWSRALRRCA